tara:strand:+ start:522 stop:1016 length:495 start_codon:yes stop_codon:yes gene_type:complete
MSKIKLSISLQNKIYLFLFLFLILNSCGFQRISQLEQNSISIKNLSINGDSRIANSLENEILLISSRDSQNALDITIKLTKRKETKEKNSQGKITKYTLFLEAEMVAKNLEKSRVTNKRFMNSSSLSVASNHSDTLRNEKKNYELMTERLAETITNYLQLYYKY